MELPAQSKATFEGKSVCTTSQVSNGGSDYNLLYFQSFSIHPCEWRTKERVLSALPPLPPAQEVAVQSAELIPGERGHQCSALLSGGGVGDLPDTRWDARTAPRS